MSGTAGTDRLTFGREERVLLAAVSRGVRVVCGMDQETETDGAGQDASTADTDRLVHLARLHGVVGLAEEGSGSGAPLPDGAAEQLRSVRDAELRRTLALCAELLRLLALFERAGIPAVPMKGPVFAHRVYGSIARRSCWDLDILLQRETVLPAKELVVAEGYVPEAAWSPRRERRELRRNCEYNFDHPLTGIHVELHWRFFERYIGFDLPMEEVWGALEPVAFMGKTLNALAAPHEALALLVHNGAKHAWERLRMVADVAVTAGRLKAAEAVALAERAKAAGAEGVMATGVHLARGLLGTPMAVLPAWSQTDRRAALAAAGYARDLFRLHPDGRRDGLAGARGYLLMRERARDRLRYVPRLLQAVLAPTDREQEMLPLPAALRPVHAVVRPFRLAGKYLGRLFAR